jgi:tRNA1Val (adenine37-N6)-methyltransferase
MSNDRKHFRVIGKSAVLDSGYKENFTSFQATERNMGIAVRSAKGARVVAPAAPGETQAAEFADVRAAAPPPADDETIDALFDGRVQLYQSRTGYRVSLDAVLLAHFVIVKHPARIVDLGAGNGALIAMLAHRHPSLRLTGIELQPAMVERARRNMMLNRLQARVQILCGDVRAIAGTAEPGGYDLAICNPPYRSALSGRVSPNPEKRVARHEFAGALGHFLRAGSCLLRKRGRMALVYPAFRCVDLLTAMRAAGIEPKRLRMVHSFRGSAASLVLADGVKGGRSELLIEPPLIIYEAQRRYTAEVARMLVDADKT